MSAMKLSIVQAASIERKEVLQLTRRVANEFEKRGYIVLPSTQEQVAKYVTQARRKRTLRTEREAVVGASALIAAGARAASGSTIKVRHIEAGWDALRRCPGNLPPPRCIRRSVIEQESSLRGELAGFSEAVDAIIKSGSF